MEGELTCQAECGRPVGLVRVRGALSAVTVPALRSAVHACLVDRPDAVVLDLSAMVAEAGATVELLSALARAAVAAAGPSIVLCTPSPQLGDRLAELAITRHLSVHRSLDDALAHAHGTGPVRRLRRRLVLDFSTSTAARSLVDEACLEWGMLGVADRASTIVTELVANAALHAATDMVVSVADLRHHLHIAVRDGSRQPPRLGGHAEGAGYGGCGLLVVDALAAAWGFVPDNTGKTVWATVQTTRWR